ncbi:PfkB family carbohydrate kinase [Ferrimonas lipolytica]|uniref:Winged helix-turn-helix transcriptional regulator n=1 Tax=Ferrimonas lipolytica TaxID=2724191 RepID=A0A6H1UHH8_9GAMM|nr:PfkB family carbohydrate kinase [Ferrimonas lipolytica]QIZ78565.1 winged helix-turn-helix transcriptional regulator [Ferrimonas lipolytica]
MTDREQQILALLRQDPMIQQQQLADLLGISRSAAAGHIMNLTRKGEIQGKGYILAAHRYAAVIGGANMDLCGRADGELISADSNPGQLRSSAGGVGRNIADNLARLGSSVQFIGAIGDDSWGEQLKQCCREAGVEVEHCLCVSGATSSSYLSIHDASGELQLALNDMALLEQLNAEQLAQREGVLNRASVLVIDANLSASALEYLFHCHSDKPIFVDPVSSVKAVKLKPYLRHIHTLKPNKLEAELLSGLTINDRDDLPKVAMALHQQGITRLLISLGHEGAFASDEQGQRFIPASATCVNNVTGAGDALMAGLVHGHLSQWDWAHCVDFALGAARLALAAANTINSTMSELSVLRQLELSQQEETSC